MKIQSKLLVVSALVLGLAAGARAATEAFDIDPVHSSVGFKIRHLVSHVPGSFTNVTGTIKVDRANLEASTVEATIAIDSVNTANDKRDGHLKSPDFFDVAKYATATFKSTAWKKTGENTYDVTGDLTLHGVTKEVALEVEVGGQGKDPWGHVRSGFTAKGSLNRKEFGLAWNQALETGGVLVAEKIEIEIELQAIAQVAK